MKRFCMGQQALSDEGTAIFRGALVLKRLINLDTVLHKTQIFRCEFILSYCIIFITLSRNTNVSTKKYITTILCHILPRLR